MKKIIAMGMIKNSADVIETFIRANSIWADKFVLLDNMCTDRTVPILNSLQEEGFDIQIIPDKEIAYFQKEKMNALLEYVVENYDPEFIIPIDDDEILSCEDGYDIKNRIMGLSRDEIHSVYWKVYFPTREDDPDEICVARRQRNRFKVDDKTMSATKIIIPGALCRSDKYPKIAQGNHRIESENDYKQVIDHDIFMAHFPIRSSEQLKSKALVGWTGYLAMPKRDNNLGLQWRLAYDLVRKGLILSEEVLELYAAMYLNDPNSDHIEKEFIPINLPSECFDIKYTTKNEINAMLNYCNCVEELALRYSELAMND